LYGELLLDQGRLKDAAAQFELSLAGTPNRRASTQGLERAVRDEGRSGVQEDGVMTPAAFFHGGPVYGWRIR
jgi:hypothetical protein